MDGNGSMSMSGRSTGAPSNPMSAKDFRQLSEYMRNTHGITLDPSLQNLDYEAVRNGIDGMDAVLKEFPQMAGTIDVVTYDPNTTAYAYASWRYRADGIRTTQIALSDHFADNSKLDAMLKKDGSFHPKNTDARAVVAHETGHALETALTRSRYTDVWDQHNARAKRKEATRIIGAAARDVKKTPEGKLPNGKSKPIGDIIGEVSRYATTNRSEALAECVGDYIANGSKAHPLSRAVWNRLKAEMG